MQASEALRQAIDEMFHSGWDKYPPLRFLIDHGWQLDRDVLTPPDRLLTKEEALAREFLQSEWGYAVDMRPPPGTCLACGRATLRGHDYCSAECQPAKAWPAQAHDTE